MNLKTEITNQNFGLKPNQLAEIKSVFSKVSGIKSILIFGSRARGDFNENSDIDLCIMGEDINLTELNNAFNQLNEQSQVPYIFDLINFNEITNKEFQNNILTEGKSIL